MKKRRKTGRGGKEKEMREGGAGESERGKNSRRTRPSKWAGECKSIPRRGARNCAPTLECGNPFSRALLAKRRYRHQHTAYECPPRVRHCNGAMRPTLQRSVHYRVRRVRRGLENRLLLRDPLRGITFPALPVTRLRSLADPRWRATALSVFHRISETIHARRPVAITRQPFYAAHLNHTSYSPASFFLLAR